MNQILQIRNVENQVSACYFNMGTVAKIQSLQQNLLKCGCDPTILVHAPPHDPNNVYYTPKHARMGRWGDEWIPE